LEGGGDSLFLWLRFRTLKAFHFVFAMPNDLKAFLVRIHGKDHAFTYYVETVRLPDNHEPPLHE
jgi:hypothetical protein